ncbi:Hypothetical predicted protein [Mytilus galloprovincialis]|uniref:Hexosyltransferase n=1 Tax=Mytilus galloprovincialis TaxID=29158 RepID=A0A8B6C7L8_MYTGA|nr:Hypothetical predicted protein [Mytilus galloprovincialis]
MKEGCQVRNLSERVLTEVDIGANVLVIIPHVDPEKVDHCNLMTVVTDKEEHAYQLEIKYGVLHGLYNRNQFELSDSNFIMFIAFQSVNNDNKIYFSKALSSNLTAKVPNTNIEKIIFDIQYNGSYNVNPLNEFHEKSAYRINPAFTMCETFNCDSLKIIFMVKSHVLNIGQIVAIRRTWGGMTTLRSRTIFIVGYLDGIDHLIQLESNHYKDILQLNLPDQYDNLVYKTIYSLLWLVHVNIKAEFIHFLITTV